MYGLDVLASQLKTLGSQTPICSATSRWSIFDPSRLFRMWSPDGLRYGRNPDCGADATSLRQDQWHRLVGLAEAVGDGDLVLFDAALLRLFPPERQRRGLRSRRSCGLTHDSGNGSETGASRF